MSNPVFLLWKTELMKGSANPNSTSDVMVIKRGLG